MQNLHQHSVSRGNHRKEAEGPAWLTAQQAGSCPLFELAKGAPSGWIQYLEHMAWHPKSLYANKRCLGLPGKTVSPGNWTSASGPLVVHQFHHQPSLPGSRATFSIKGLKKGHWVVVPILILGLIFRALGSVSSVSEKAMSTQTYCVMIKLTPGERRG